MPAQEDEGEAQLKCRESCLEIHGKVGLQTAIIMYFCHSALSELMAEGSILSVDFHVHHYGLSGKLVFWEKGRSQEMGLEENDS